jgi:hypothetical protein
VTAQYMSPSVRRSEGRRDADQVDHRLPAQHAGTLQANEVSKDDKL